MNIVDLAIGYVEPEAKRLIKEGRVPYDFRIRQALVLLPHGRLPVISFNEGITWQMQMDTSQFEEGQAIYLHDLRKITGVAFPKHNGQKVAYIFMFYTGAGYNLLFDFSPNLLTQNSIPDYGHGADRALTSYYNLYFSEMALNLTLEDKLSELHEAGFFISPAIMPYPFSVLANPNKSAQEFISTLIEYFNASTLKAMVNEWSHLPAWNDRLHLFIEAADNFRQERWASVIAVLTPQLEGTLRDAIFLLYGDESYMNAQQALRRPWKTQAICAKIPV